MLENYHIQAGGNCQKRSKVDFTANYSIILPECPLPYDYVMTTIPLRGATVEAKLAVIKACIAGVLNCEHSEVSSTSRLSEIFSAEPEKIQQIWMVLHELQEYRLRISGDWSPYSLASEWHKACMSHP